MSEEARVVKSSCNAARSGGDMCIGRQALEARHLSIARRRHAAPFSIPFESEALLEGGEGIGVRTRRGGKVGERAGEGGRGLQIRTGIGPA